MHDSSTSSWKLVGMFVVIAFMGTAAAHAFSFDRTTTCDRLNQQRGYDQWAVLEYRIEPGTSQLPEVELEHSSDASFADELMYCVRRQKMLLPRDGTGQHVLFRYQPADHLVEARDNRRLRFHSPSWLNNKLQQESYSGNLAIRMEIGEDGTIRRKEVLFSSDYRLGQWILDSLDEAIRVESRGGRSGGYVDVLYMRFQSTGLTFFEQLHYKRPSNL